MEVIVDYETKTYTTDRIMKSQKIEYKNVTGNVKQDGRIFQVQLIGDEKETFEVLRLIWELAFLYDGYFYTPKRYMVDGEESNVAELYFLSFYESGKSWREAATTLAGYDKDFSKQRLLEYNQFRNTGRESGKLLKSLINSFFYLHSDAYERININHRLSLFLNMCDGLNSNINGHSNNVQAGISWVLGDNLDIKLVKEGSAILGVPKSKMYEALRNERHEIDHYIVKEGSITEYERKAVDKTRNYVNLYFVYVIELALRIAFLKQIGYQCPVTLKEYAMNEIYDWVIMQCGIPVECKNDYNKFKQNLQRLGLEIK